jgi:malate synthase
MSPMADFITSTSINIKGEMLNDSFSEILSFEALEFVAGLERTFGPMRKQLLRERESRQARIDAGELPDFLPETLSIRTGTWTISPIPPQLNDRRVEITGPASDRKMVINAFNSGAKVYMSDFEDANSPTWSNTIAGQINLRDAINRKIHYENPDGKSYSLEEKTAVLKVRPRGWHLEEKHVYIDGRPLSASLLDFGLYFFHNAKTLIEGGSGPYFYLPKLESHMEARLWNDVFEYSQRQLGIPQGSIKATVLIETILAAFEMDEILYELREHIVGLNCGRWDYIFSYIKKMCKQPNVILPDRGLITMESPFMNAYSLFAIQTCHKRKAHCIGGMAAQIPVKGDTSANDEAMTKVQLDKLREVKNGHDGTWVAHPGLVPLAIQVFDEHMPLSNQIDKLLSDITITAEDLLEVPEGLITEAGVRNNVSVGIQYIEAWLRGYGAVPINNLMEDVATAEISRAQLWQWIHHPKGILSDGRKLTEPLFEEILNEELEKIKRESSENNQTDRKFDQSCEIFRQLTLFPKFEDFLTIQGYQYL